MEHNLRDTLLNDFKVLRSEKEKKFKKDNNYRRGLNTQRNIFNENIILSYYCPSKWKFTTNPNLKQWHWSDSSLSLVETKQRCSNYDYEELHIRNSEDKNNRNQREYRTQSPKFLVFFSLPCGSCITWEYILTSSTLTNQGSLHLSVTGDTIKWKLFLVCQFQKVNDIHIESKELS